MTRKVEPLIHLEQLEPRIMLSGDGLLNIAPNPDQNTILDEPSTVVQEMELLHINEQVEEQISQEPAPSDTPNTDVYPPLFTLFVDDNNESVDADLSINNVGSAQVNGDIIVLSNDSDGDIESKVGTTEDGIVATDIDDTNLSTEYTTSIEIRGPPATQTVTLSGLHLVEPTADYFDDQVVYLNFDGEQDVTYNGPVFIEGINVPAFSAPDYLAGKEQAIIIDVLEELNDIFAGSGIIFTTEKPEPGKSFSTIFVGGDDSAFAEYGSFLGLAEQVDVANQSTCDKAFVFSDNIGSVYSITGSYSAELSHVIAHEIGHLLGYAHDYDHADGGILSVVANGGTSFGIQQVISNQADEAYSVYACDLDGDGDNDVLSASLSDDKIAWYENLGGAFGPQKVISTQADGAHWVYACDLDGDGDNDVISASVYDDKIAWYENRLNEPTADFGSQQVISIQADQAASVYACDLDGDGDNDVLSASINDDKIAWYKNDGGGVFGIQQVIDTDVDYAASVYACDLDGDGDNDVLSASRNHDRIAWYENDGSGTFGGKQSISTAANGAMSVYACDLDGDGDNDVLSASWFDNKIAWYENSGDGTFGPQRVISIHAHGTYSVYACDLDGDGDNDVLSASYIDDKIAWYENVGGGTFGSQQVISTQADGAYSVYACDLDGDGDNDVLSASILDDKIAWYENLRSPGVGSPEIDVERNGTDDVHTHSFGTLETEQSVSQEFTVRNEGDAELVVIQAGGLDSPFSISPLNSGESNDDWVISAGGTQIFTVSFSSDNEGNYSDILVLTSNDSDEGSYQISFTGIASGPEIEVLGNSQVILDGDTTPNPSDHTDFGVIYVGGSVARTFTIRNIGSEDLNLTGSPDRVVITGSGDFTVTQQPSSPALTNGGTTTFEITFDPSGYGTKTATISIANDDYNEDPYDFVIQGTGVLFSSQQVISTLADGAWSVYACDLDGDGDNDVLQASRNGDKIAWHENLGGGNFSGEQVISTQMDGPRSIYACDLDGDGDNDVLSASVFDRKIAWYENLGGGTFGPQQVISTQASGVRSVYACDLDGDGDNDVLSASENDNKIAWYENLGDGTFGPQQVISTQAVVAYSVYAIDLDGDGDNDVLSASEYDDKIAWYENMGGGTFGSQQVISTQADKAHSVYACDLDGDGDNDVLSASQDAKIAWYENLGGGTFSNQQLINNQAFGAYSVYACDLDGDGDNDVLSGETHGARVAWYENLGGGNFGIQQVITTQASEVRSVYACDLDGDGDNDVLSASSADDKIAWYENLRSPGVGLPEIDVERDGIDDVHAHAFGTLEAGQSVSKEFTVRNEGNVVLVVTQTAGLVSPFSISPFNNSGSTDDWVIPAGGTQTFTVSFTPVNAGDYSDTLVLTSNDSDEGSYQISFTGTTPGPEIEVLGNSQVILDGDTTPNPSDHTDFGSIYTSSGSVTRTFTVGNTGSEVLNLIGSPDRVVITGSGDFTVTQQPASPVAAYGGTTIFEITFDPSSYETKTATISIASNDYNEDPYNFVIQGTGVLFGNQQVISIQADRPASVYACDLDGDGDNDVLSASSIDDKIAWYENLGGGTFSIQKVISTQADYAVSVYACDLDGDGDNDVLSVSYFDDKIAWYENLGGGTFSSIQQVISTQADWPESVYACDLDGDGDNDVLSASSTDDKIAWYENLGDGTFGPQQVISTQAVMAYSVYACDLDGDGDNDVLSASEYDDKIAWYENRLNEQTADFGTQQVISVQADGAASVYACDLDGDGDNDVLSASVYDDKIAWYENLGGGTFSSIQQVISTQADKAYSVYACDLDGDGDNDVLSASAIYDNKIAWYENLGSGAFGSQQVISTQAYGANSVYACDLDGDGDNDVLLASSDDDKIAWYENLREPGVGLPEIDVERNGTDDIHAHSFGTLGVGQSVSQEFTVRNEGDAVLVVTQTAGLVSPFSINPVNNNGSTDDWVIPAGGTQTFTVSFSPELGNYSDTLVLTCNDSDEGSYLIDFTGAATGPEIEVLGNSQVILDGDTTPSLSDHTDFVAIYVGYSVTRTFTVRNTGSEVLNLTGNPDRVVVTGSGDFTVTQQPTSPVAANGGTTTFEITFDPSSIETKTATISIANNDYNEDPYNFVIKGTCELFGSQQVINTQADGALSVYACDLDGDGDNDVLSYSWNDNKIAWYENLGSGTFGSEQVISTQADYASVYACDLDGDGDNDVLSASYYDNTITWYENLGGGIFSSEQVISIQTVESRSVYACDLDGDGDNDVLSASAYDDKIAWYENLGGGIFGSQQIISTQANAAQSVYACDLDGDGDNDVLSASYYDDKIAWYENRLNEQTADFGSQQVISTQADGARSVYACDLDGDGDNDVLSASQFDDEIAWYENRLNEQTADFGSQQAISTQADGAFSVYACDLDGDGDKDILSASMGDDKIAWYENQGGGTFGNQQVITTQADGTRSVYACDLDGDGDNDVLSASVEDDKIAWYENLRSSGAGSPEIDVERNGTDDVHAHSFGTIQVGQSVSQEFTVRNEGNVVLVVTQTAGLVSPFSIIPINNSGSTDDWVIPAGGTQIFTVSFSSDNEGNYSDTLVLTNNDSNEGNYWIQIAAAVLDLDNVALGKAASQSSTHGPGSAERAVDGNTSGNWYDDSVTHTGLQTHPWWQVDLGEVYSEISGIEIWNRTDTDAVKNRLDDFYVFVSDVPFVSGDLAATLAQSGVWSQHQVGVPDPNLMLPVGRSGRYVRVQLGDTNYLNLAEVKVFAPVTVPSVLDNVALGKAASQSSTHGPGSAERAVDGNTSGNWYDDSVTHTGLQTNPWWQVDLGEVYSEISGIEIWNRTDTDAVKNRLDDFYVFVSDVPFVSGDLAATLAQSGVWSQHQVGVPDPNLMLPVGRSGRYVRVQLGDTNYLNLAEVKVFAPVTVPSVLDNVALGKAASQSSTHGLGSAERAVDGNTSGNWYDDSVTHTGLQTNPWWQVDLGEVYSEISGIEIWNRTDTDAVKNRLDDFYVFVSDVPFVSGDLAATLAQSGVWSQHQVGVPDPNLMLPVGRSGRYVRVQLGDTNYLNLAEVKVFAPVTVPSVLDNVALGKAASQSSTHGLGSAERAVDGNTSGNWYDDSVTHTGLQTNPWWQVDLGEVYSEISGIEIWNRTDTDAVKNRLDDFYVFVSDVPFVSGDLAATLAQSGVWSQHQVGVPDPNLMLPVGRSGRYVRVQLGDTNYLNLAEVKVFAPVTVPSVLDNVALGKAASQSSTHGLGSAERAVDGNTSGNWYDDSVTHTGLQTNPWWQVDLGEVYSEISGIEIWNRTDTDAVKNRLDDFYVFVSDVPFVSGDLAATLAQSGVWSQHQVGVPDPNLMLPVGRSGRYVRVQLGDTNYLNLAEVKVFATA